MKLDQLSNLPEGILHDILSRLPEEDAARASVLSKAWAQTWSTFPILSFSDSKIVGTRTPCYIKELFDNVERKLLRFRNQGLAIKQFKLSVRSFDLYLVSEDVDLCLKLAVESGVEVLKLNRYYRYFPQYYILPMGILEAKSLTKLVLKGRIKVDFSFINHSMKLFSLKVLKLKYVLLGDEHTFKVFISRCPLIEYITLSPCHFPHEKGHLQYNLESLSLCGLPKLKGVVVQGIKEVYIDSLCLENLHYSLNYYQREKMDFSNCRNLRALSLRSLSTIITNEWFFKLFANFPLLEGLELEYCKMFEMINISSAQLKVLKLSGCSYLKKLNVDAPNLVSCVYGCHTRAPKFLSFLRCSSQLKVDVWIDYFELNFYKFRKFIKNFKPKIALASVSLSIYWFPEDALNRVLFQVSSPPPSIKHLVLKGVPKNEEMYLPIVYELLSTCCPANISIYIGLNFRYFRSFVEFFYEMLKGGKVDNCFCISSNTRCWWHHIKQVKVISSMNIDDNVDFKTMLDTMFSVVVSEHNLRFMLEF